VLYRQGVAREDAAFVVSLRRRRISGLLLKRAHRLFVVIELQQDAALRVGGTEEASANDLFPSVRRNGRELIGSRRHNRQFGLLGGHTSEDFPAVELAGKPWTDSQ
jgi:hypothetical protein